MVATIINNKLNKIIYFTICLLLIGLLSCGRKNSGGTTPNIERVKLFQSILEKGIIPSDLANYDDMSEMIFSNYTAGAMVVVRYVTINGSGDGVSWTNATNDMWALLDGISDASADKIYVIMVASGAYKPSASYVMKNYVALVGGFTAMNSGNYDRTGETRLDGNNNKRVFNNTNNDLNNTALLYGVVITNGKTDDRGGGMYNEGSSPTLINVTFSGNTGGYGGGMYNDGSSLTLINVTFSGNTASTSGGGMYNEGSSPTLINVTFSGNTGGYGGGMYNSQSSSPTLINITFSGNKANNNGGGLNNIFSSSPILINATFSDNTANDSDGGGGVYHDGNGEDLTLINTILWENNNGNIYTKNDAYVAETVNLYYSLIEGGTNASTTATGIRLDDDNIATRPIEIVSEKFITNNPGLGTSLADNGGEVDTVSISGGSPAKDKGVYVRGIKAGNSYPEANLYYSMDNTSWFSDSGLTNPVANLPSNAGNLTTTDARGYSRVGRPDIGAYEVGGMP